jgi:poly-gamma-glutamate capsule biosynthesis protein CapA/YwtB (metallophosphatase superfamily)
VSVLEDLSDRTLRALLRTSDLLVASIHWGGNWSYDIPAQQTRFAHGLIDEVGFRVIHGHSSHHPKGIEIYRDRPILYGCGDF